MQGLPGALNPSRALWQTPTPMPVDVTCGAEGGLPLLLKESLVQGSRVIRAWGSHHRTAKEG